MSISLAFERIWPRSTVQPDDHRSDRGVDIKWFGADQPHAFTSRYDSWKYLGEQPDLPQTRAALATTCDIRVPLTFIEEDCAAIVRIFGDEAARLTAAI